MPLLQKALEHFEEFDPHWSQVMDKTAYANKRKRLSKSIQNCLLLHNNCAIRLFLVI